MRHRVVVLLATAMALLASHVHAQAAAPPPAATQGKAPAKSAPAAKKPDTGKAVEGLTVTGASQNGMRSSIDRRSYGVANDLATTTGSISDALKNVPSVEVDVQGNVSLRGDTNVTILIDGKPSGQFRGASAAQALQSMPADSVERVEVITNPSAQFSPEGSAGIINLITKQTHRAGKSGSLRLNVGTDGRVNGGFSGAYNSSKLTVTADVGARHEPNDATVNDDRIFLDGLGYVVGTNAIHQENRAIFDQWNGRTSVDYDADAATRLSGELRYNHFRFNGHNALNFDGRDATGAPNLTYEEPIDQVLTRGNGAIQGSLRRKFAGDDHVMTLNISRERTEETVDRAVDQMISLPVGPNFFIGLKSRNTLTLTEAKADYSRPMADDAKLKAGYDLRVDQNDYDNVGQRGTSAADAGPDPIQTNLFLYKQTINAAYVTYERPFGAWTVLGGLRLEEVQLDLNQVTTNLVHNTDDFKAYPSLHLAYKFTQDQQLILSYSKRVQRPNPQDLNPFRVERDPQVFTAGNSDLRPQQTDSYEVGYQYKAGATFYLATLYYRHNEHGVTDVVTELAGGALLNTKKNLRNSQAAGLELVANGRLTKTLTYNASTNLYWNEIDATGQGLSQVVGIAGRRQAFAGGGRANLNWQATPTDTFQVSAQLNAKRLIPQGFSDPFLLTFLGYRHKFSDSLSGVVTVQDVLHTFKFHTVIDTLTLREITMGRPAIQAVFVGLTWNFGAPSKRPRDQSFDFGGGAPQP